MLHTFNYRKGIAISSLLVSNLIFVSQSIAEISVIVHPDNNSTFDKTIIKKMFLGKSKSFDNGKVVILLSPKTGTSASDEFNKNVLRKTAPQINAYWSKMIFTGKGTPPQEMESADDIISAIAGNKDAISFVDTSSVTDAVKVVATF
tara:strand:+ start:652 stop:1092 length:441 start_codon:yes stop_codon:yes gene_type:complete